eukprot:scaffold2456_cov129-Isochrysis_galbana.AAC.9
MRGHAPRSAEKYVTVQNGRTPRPRACRCVACVAVSPCRRPSQRVHAAASWPLDLLPIWYAKKDGLMASPRRMRLNRDWRAGATRQASQPAVSRLID